MAAFLIVPPNPLAKLSPGWVPSERGRRANLFSSKGCAVFPAPARQAKEWVQVGLPGRGLEFGRLAVAGSRPVPKSQRGVLHTLNSG